MFQTLLVTFREGLEAFLIIAIAAMYLRRTQRAELVSALRIGTVVAIVASLVLGVVLSRVGALSPLWEGVMALIAAVTVITCTVHMMRIGKHMKRMIDGKLDAAALKSGSAAWWAIFVFAVFMVGREGVETATMLASLTANESLRHLALGGLAGVGIAAAIAWAWTMQGHKVNLARFFQVTSIFMILFSAQLLIYAFHEFTEVGAIAVIDNEYWHEATEDLAEGTIGQLISISLVLVPSFWLLFAYVADRRKTASRTAVEA